MTDPADHFADTPSQPHASMLQDQLEANEGLLLAALRAQEDAEAAHSSRIVAEGESDGLRGAAAELIAAAELRERLLGMVGHDLRNPLNTIVVAAQLLAEGNNLPERGAWLASRIVESGQRMGRMINQLANFTRTRTGGGFELSLGLCDLSRICWNVVEELRLGSLGSGGRIVLSATGDLRGSWDADRLADVLANLISNGLDHAAAGTSVLVQAREEAGSVIVQVINDGPCIPPDLLGSIFDAFRGVPGDPRRNAGYLGLGLYISREIAVSHGGSLEVRSVDMKTTFTLRLPRAPLAERSSRSSAL